MGFHCVVGFAPPVKRERTQLQHEVTFTPNRRGEKGLKHARFQLTLCFLAIVTGMSTAFVWCWGLIPKLAPVVRKTFVSQKCWPGPMARGGLINTDVVVGAAISRSSLP
jgi:hypothetical protein